MDFNKQQPEGVFNQLIHWAEQRESIRAMLLTSTRAVPNAPVDMLSDYDVILVADDIHPFHEDRTWLEDFGEVLVVYCDPLYPDPYFGTEKFGNVTQYADGLKIDFTLCLVAWLQQVVQTRGLPAELDAGYRVLLDKDNLTLGMQTPSYKSYIPVPPTHEAYQRVIEDFFSDVPYVAKCLWRDELLPMKWCLDYDMKHVYLRRMLEWKIGLDTNWSMPVGSLGKGLKKLLSAEIWSQLQSAYADANVEDNWEALFQTIAVYRQVAIEVGKRLGYAYPYELDRRVTAYVQKMHDDLESHGGL